MTTRTQITRIGAAAIAALIYLLIPTDAIAAKGGGSISRAGDNASNLISGIVGPILIVLVGVVAIVAMIQRQVSLAIGAGLCALFAGWFLFSPASVETAFNGIYKAIF